ncbi:PepSY-associated TM region [Novosphingobium sp. CF614]|uniref:PepSY-associated TM helix domain-containing protein n=1 Tax=Novosphingobium sp. CF614 TaxID=1884364 RepID=UPI0008E4D882|nr:PepSY-associated TM helix domain-containing protein [Novosphingobium sp. CF614]SFG42421.1 PepSY-associated TM region [Novosphingobium sp. CF614]
MTMRRWHRWLALPAGLFLAFVALTGTLLHLDMMRLGQHPPGSDTGPLPPVQPIPDDAQLATMITRLADAARRDPSVKVQSLQINLAGPAVTLVAGAGGPPGSPQIKLVAASGRRIVDPPPPADFHYILQDLHAGYFFGWPGRILSVLCGISLLVLALTGLQMWWDMRRGRRSKSLFWK